MSYDKETGLYTGYIYMIECDVNHKKYIGQTTKTPYARFYAHKYNAKKFSGKKCGKLAEAIYLLGEEHFDFCIIIEKSFKNRSDLHRWLDEQEVRYIAYYDTTNSEKGYNDCIGGTRKTQKTYVRNMRQYDFSGNYIATYTVNTLPDEFSVNEVQAACNGLYSNSYGYIWRYDDEPLDKYPLPTVRSQKTVITKSKTVDSIVQYDRFGNVVNEYENIQTIADKYNLNYSTIVQVCTGLKPYYGEYVYRFKGEPFDKYGYFNNPRIIDGKIEYFQIWDPNKKIYVYNEKGSLLKECPSKQDVYNSFGVSQEALKLALTKRQPYTYCGRILVFSRVPLTLKETSIIVEKGYKVYVYDLNHNFIGKYTSFEYAENNFRNYKIRMFLKGETQKIHSKYLFSSKPLFTKEDFWEVESKTITTPKSRKVVQFSKNGDYIATYSSIAEANRNLLGTNEHKCGISDCCNGKNKTAYGYKFYFADDPNCPAIE